MNDHLHIITGHYGSGKTEVSVNLAFRFKREGNAVTIADLDIVNPYFCSRERKDEMRAQGIRVIVSKGADSDLPAINPEVYALFEPNICGIIDAGGDAVGAADSAGSALAELGARLSGQFDLRHSGAPVR